MTSAVVVYSPTNESAEDTKEAFLEQLQSVLNNIPKHDVLIVIGDVNAKAVSNNEGHESAMRKHGIGKRNDNGHQQNTFKKLVTAIWNEEVITPEWNKGLIVKIPKKGDRSVCNNYRGITLSLVPIKVFSRVVIQRIREEVEKQLHEEQASFRKGRSTTEEQFTLRNIIEQCTEWNTTL
jgi:hypothetical protein